MGTETKAVTAGVLLIITVFAGVWLSRSGQPYSTVLLNIHKLIALASVVVAVIVTASLLRAVGLPTLVAVLVAVAGLSIVALFATGALLSMGKASHAFLRSVHVAATVVVIPTSIIAVYLLLKKIA